MISGTQGLWPAVWRFWELESILMPQHCPSARRSSPGLMEGLPHIRGYAWYRKTTNVFLLSWTRVSRDLPPLPVTVAKGGWRSKGQLIQPSHHQTACRCHLSRHCTVMAGICPQEALSHTSSAHGQANTPAWRGVPLGAALPNFLLAGGSQSPLRPLLMLQEAE